MPLFIDEDPTYQSLATRCDNLKVLLLKFGTDLEPDTLRLVQRDLAMVTKYVDVQLTELAKLGYLERD